MLEAEIVLILYYALTSVIINKGEDGQDDSKLRNTNTSVTKGIYNRPGVTKPGDFGKNETTNESRKCKVVIASLRQNVATASVTD